VNVPKDGVININIARRFFEAGMSFGSGIRQNSAVQLIRSPSDTSCAGSANSTINDACCFAGPLPSGQCHPVWR